MTTENLEVDGDDIEFGAPEEVQADFQRHVDHAIASLTDALARAHWKVGQHAAEIDALKQAYAEKDSEAKAWKQAADHWQGELQKLRRAHELRVVADAGAEPVPAGK